MSASLTLREGMADSYKLEEFHEFDPLNPEWRLSRSNDYFKETTERT